MRKEAARNKKNPQNKIITKKNKTKNQNTSLPK